MDETQVSFRSGDLTLEGLLANPGGGAPAAVVCHPHPMYGGSMYNNVVEAMLAAMWQAGYATLRFNFRGVGASEGEHDGGPGEVDDAVGAMSFLLAQPGVRKEDAAMAGYSFGAMVAMSAGYERAEIARIVAVALPLAMAEASVPGRRIQTGAAGLRRSRFVLAGRGTASARVENRRIGATGDHRGRRSLLRRPRSGSVTRDRCRDTWLTSLGTGGAARVASQMA